MTEKLIPSAQDFYNKLVKEKSLPFEKQRVEMATRILSTKAHDFNEIHLTEWYGDFWRLAGFTAEFSKIYEADEKFIAEMIKGETDSTIERQLKALVLILFGKLQDAEKIADKKIWSKNLREDFNVFKSWCQLISNVPTLENRARISHDRAVKEFLTEKYSHLIERHASTVITSKNCPKVSTKDYKIFYGWLQGEENLPVLARCCYNSLKENAGGYEIVFIDEKNFSEYVEIPAYIFEKYKAGKIKPAHFADVLRMNLLEQYGGLWLDATILVTEPLERYKKFFKLPFYSQKFTHEKNNLHPITVGFSSYSAYARWAGFVQGTAVTHNPLYAFAKDFYNEYWREFDEIIDYVLMDFIIAIAYDNMPAVKKEIDECPINNEKIWTLSPYLNLPYENFPYEQILRGNFLNKVSSRKQLDFTAEGTVLRAIQRRYAPETLMQ